MASQKEIGATYNWIDDLFRVSIGETGDYTGAKFDGDFSLTLEQAQARKRAHILKGIGFKPGQRILDIGCGWGPMLNEIQKRGGEAVGLTLSTAQYKACKKNGLDARLLDYKKATIKDIGTFDHVVSVGAFEAFCSIKEVIAGKQKEVYRKFFEFASKVMPKGGNLYLQTMMWGKRVPSPKELDLKAPKGSDARIIALLSHFYPGQWLPEGMKQIKKIASPYFNFISSTNGRKDYIHTISEWVRKMKKPSLAKVRIAANLAYNYITDKEFRLQVQSVRENAQTEVFKRRLFEHERMFFSKV